MKQIKRSLNFIMFFALILSNSILAQDSFSKQITSSDFKPTENKSIIFTDSLTNQSIEQIYFESGQIKSENIFVSPINKKFHGKQTYWYENGMICSEVNFNHGKKNGAYKTYWENGVLKRFDTFKNGKLIKGNCYNDKGEEVKYYNFYIDPKFPGGDEGLAIYLSQNLKYPKNSRTSSSVGKVIVSCNIDEEGSIVNATIVKGVNNILNEEALRVILKMPNWEPALRNGNAISSEINLPLIYIRQ